ncbi:PepSY-associated TM helix domain-containing protein (plasmid) [Tistrella bauzanensis]|uniref:PepSY-associated TM helix domain-containing protein n=1 Tax=Tistrella TaxID=171436 RepID=UPI0031F716F2
MAWLHEWAGLLLGWLLFAIFLTGTIAFFRDEVTHWMQPELHGLEAEAGSADRGVAWLAANAAGAGMWMLSLPGERDPSLGLAWRPEGAPAGRAGIRRAQLAPATGEPLAARETAGGDFLYRFHFELYGMPRNTARWIVGIATMAMFVAIISGIITHRRIFKDIFTFRPDKAGQRSWLDAHNATAVLALPFHVMITYSGLVLLAGTLLPFAFEGPRGGGGGGAGDAPRAAGVSTAMMPAPTVALAPLLADAEHRWGAPAGSVTITAPGRPGARIELRPLHAATLASAGRAGDRLVYDAATGQLVDAVRGADGLSTVGEINTVIGVLHRARFSEPALRWLFFISGVAGTVMVATGLVLWVVKRAAQHARNGGPSIGFRIVERLNVAGIAGLCLAAAGYFWANRLIPADLAGRAEWEIRAFFVVWAAAALHALLRPVRVAWTEQLGVTAGLLAMLPLASLPGILAGDARVIGFDLVAIATAAGLFHAARRLARPAPTAKPASRRRPAAAVAGDRP